jgi:hypothetical protein
MRTALFTEEDADRGAELTLTQTPFSLFSASA